MKCKENKLLRLLLAIVDFIEIYIPAIAFTGIFIIFVIQIFARYLFKSPLTWSYDLTMTLYVYAIMLGACYTLRHNEHINFSMLYDAFSPKVQLWLRVIGNLVVVLIFVFALPSCINYALLHKVAIKKKTSVLYIQYRWLYLPMIVMMIDTIVRLFIGIIKDLKHLLPRRGGERQ